MFRSMLAAVAVVVLLCFSSVAFAQTDCEGEIGEARGLCNAYCEAMACASDTPLGSPVACQTVLSKFSELTGGDRLAPQPVLVIFGLIQVGKMQRHHVAVEGGYPNFQYLVRGTTDGLFCTRTSPTV